ncbi:MAG: carbohydrate ABC transporter permease [Metallibacterium scheffleri]|jgi:multiple sugar transport system permease protein|uniref:carbohydrate ABC transporter permease n=1 Tax=Metallibacterium scheffleri TaxID=993689 RepID=UPI0026ED3E01|nr:carbohydrate ABC transporter permease [Metallibacterium scheffleri]MCK9366421.1 carbohydrate ABC transporter permease [Metallibacterium scheffleri]
MKSSRAAVWGVNGLLALLALLALFPLLWMLSVSLMPLGSASTFPPPLLPLHPTLANYRALFVGADLGRYLLNSLIVSGGITLGSLACNVLAGYAFAKLRYAGRERTFNLLLGALVIPTQVAMMPLFLLARELHIVNSYAGVILPSLASIFGIYLVRQYARAIPTEMLEAARIDGASEFRIFARVVLPLLKPIILTLTILTFLTAWNDFMWPLIVLTGSSHYTLPIALASLARQHNQDVEMLMAGSMVTVVPVLVLFLLLQRYYIQGLLLGSVKG